MLFSLAPLPLLPTPFLCLLKLAGVSHTTAICAVLFRVTRIEMLPFVLLFSWKKKNYVHGVHVCLCTTRLQCSCRLEKGIRSSGTELPCGSSGREAHALNHKEFPLHPFPFLAPAPFPSLSVSPLPSIFFVSTPSFSVCLP